jgi:hypothetical protein
MTRYEQEKLLLDLQELAENAEVCVNYAQTLCDTARVMMAAVAGTGAGSTPGNGKVYLLPVAKSLPCAVLMAARKEQL